MKVEFCCDSGANIHSCRKQVLDTQVDLGLDEGEWQSMRDDDKQQMVEEWANERLEIYWKEL